MERNSGGGYGAQRDGKKRQEQTLGGRIRALRTARGLTQEQLAERILVTRQAVAKWENDNGVPDVDNLVRLADAFGVSADALLGRNENPAGQRAAADGDGSAKAPFEREFQSTQPPIASTERERRDDARRERERRYRPLAAGMSAVAAVCWGISAALAYRNGLPLLCGLQTVCTVIWTVNAVYHTIKLRQGR